MSNDRISKWLQRELDAAEAGLRNGEITPAQYETICTQVQREAREIAREEAQRAYDNEMDNA